ncbi:MAG TPA: glycosyl hydrolase family 28-related protein [Longimicrobiales bacterium]
MESRRDFVKGLVSAPVSAALGAFTAPSPDADPRDHLPGPVLWVDAHDFGAVGDGRSDDAPAIQAAIRSLEGRRGIVVLRPGRYRCLSPLDLHRAHLMGSGVPGNAGGGGTTLDFTAGHGILSSIEDNFAFELSFLRILGATPKQSGGQVLVDFTGQNYPRMRECRLANADIGLRLRTGRRVECHYGAFFNVHVDRCRVGISIEGPAHSQKFFGGRIWDCTVGARNEGANDIVFFGTEFESDTPLHHPPRQGRAYPVTVLVGTRQESERAPVIESGSITDVASYWSGYRRPRAFRVREGNVLPEGQVITVGVPGDARPVKQNFLRNPALVPSVDEASIPGWTFSGGTPEFLMGPFGRIVRFSNIESNHHYLEQTGIRLLAGTYQVGYGFQTEGAAECRIYVYDGDRPLLEAERIPADYAGGIVRRGFSLERDSDQIRIRLYRAGTRATTIYYYAPYIVPAYGGEPFLPVSEESRPNRIAYSPSPPPDGVWGVGDIVYNTAPTPGGFVGWVCVETGRPGVWKGFGRIEG